MRSYNLNSFSRRVFADKYKTGKPTECGRLVGLDYGPTHCGIAVMNPQFTDWEPYGNVYMQNKEPPNKFSNRFNPYNWGAKRSFDQSLSELAKSVLDQKPVGLVVGLSDKPTPKQLLNPQYVNSYDETLNMIKTLRLLGLFPEDFPLLLVDEHRTSKRSQVRIDHGIISFAQKQGYRFWSRREAQSSFVYKELWDSYAAGHMLDIYVDSLRYPYGDNLTFDGCFGRDFMELHCTGVVEVEGVDFRSNSFFEPEVVSAEEFEFRNDRLWCTVKAQLDRDRGDNTLLTILDSKFKKDYNRMWSMIESKASEVGLLSSLDLSKQMDDRMLYKMILELFKRR